MKKLVIYSFLASISSIFSFTELVEGTLIIARIAAVIFVILFVLSLVHIIYPHLKSKDS